MKEVLLPLTQMPGMKQVLVIGMDGLLMESSSVLGAEEDFRSHEAASALVLGWVKETEAHLEQSSFEGPSRFVLRGSRATLVVCRGPNVWLAVWLEPGALPEDLRVPMEAALGRIARLLRGLDSSQHLKSDSAIPGPQEPAAPLPRPRRTLSAMKTSSNLAGPVHGRAGQHPLKEDA